MGIFNNIFGGKEEKTSKVEKKSFLNWIPLTTLEQLEDQLQPELFFRISRKFFININAVKDIVAYTNSRLKIQLHKFNGQDLIVSRERVKEFKNWLG